MAQKKKNKTKKIRIFKSGLRKGYSPDPKSKKYWKKGASMPFSATDSAKKSLEDTWGI